MYISFSMSITHVYVKGQSWFEIKIFQPKLIFNFLCLKVLGD